MFPKKIILILFICFSGMSVVSYGQVSQYSPYSFYGLGDRVIDGFSQSGLIGGTGIANGSGRCVNYLNPAALYNTDSTTVILDLEIDYGLASWKTYSEISHYSNVSLRYIAVGMKPNNFYGLSFGVVPYAQSGYQLTDNITTPGDNYTYQKIFSGEGGINSVFLNNAFSVTKFLSLGIGASYYFGSQNFTEEIIPETEVSYVIQESRFSHALNLQFGMDYHQKLGESALSLGLIYNQKKKFSNNSEFIIYSSEGNVLDYYNSSIKELYLPTKYGGGLSVNLKNKVILSADYQKQEWGKTGPEFENIKIADETKYSGGIQWNYGLGPFNRRLPYISIFAGGYYNEGYMIIYGQRLNRIGITGGLEFPVHRGYNTFRIGYSYDDFGTTTRGLTRIRTHSIKLSMSLSDRWFIKYKID